MPWRRCTPPWVGRCCWSLGRPSEARGYANELRAWAADPDAVLLFPETDALPYDRLPNDPGQAGRAAGHARAAGRHGGRQHRPPLVVASVRAAMDLVLDPQRFRDNHRVIKPRPGAAAGRARHPVAAAWATSHRRWSTQPGSVQSPRRHPGRVPAGRRSPLRIELWGDEIDTIRLFDPATQRSTEQLEAAAVGPAHEVLPRPLPRQPRARHACDRSSSTRSRATCGMLREGSQAFAALEFYRGFLGSGHAASTTCPPTACWSSTSPRPSPARRRSSRSRSSSCTPTCSIAAKSRPAWRGRIGPGARRRSRGGQRPRLDVELDPDADSLPFEHAPKYGGRLDPFLTHAGRGRRARPSWSASRPAG